jgi:hypothetical protein
MRRNAEKEQEMNLRVYYQKIRDAEARIADEFPIVVSKETTDGGKGGTKTEVPRKIAARLIVEGVAEVAGAEETAAFRAAAAKAKRIADQISASARMQVTVISTADLENLKGNPHGSKE